MEKKGNPIYAVFFLSAEGMALGLSIPKAVLLRADQTIE